MEDSVRFRMLGAVFGISGAARRISNGDEAIFSQLAIIVDSRRIPNVETGPEILKIEQEIGDFDLVMGVGDFVTGVGVIATGDGDFVTGVGVIVTGVDDFV